MAVTACVCHHITFGQLKSILERTGAGLVELHQMTQCGSRCGLCIPYIRYMIQTGDADPPVMWSADFRALGIKCTAIQRLEARLIAQGKIDANDVGGADSPPELHHNSG